MDELRLVQIDPSGRTVEPVGRLSEVGRQACESLGTLYGVVGFLPPWVGYVGVVGGQAVGTCAFKSPPSAGRVEIAYFTFPEHEGRGYATAMARALIGVARAAQPGILITARTLPQHSASVTILTKLGFTFADAVVHPDDGKVWEWHLPTSAGR